MLTLLPYLKNTVYSASSLRNQIFIKNIRNLISQSSVVTQDIVAEPKWQLVAAACITRAPIICPPMTTIEKSYKNLSEKMEFETSKINEHELRLAEDKMRISLISVGEVSEVSIEDTTKQTGIEFEDVCKDELKDFTFSPLVTECDKAGDKSSMNRALDRALVLSVNQKLGSQSHRVFPQTPWIPGETLKQSCERVIREICGDGATVKVFGNSPCGHFKYKYPKEVRKGGYIGAKVFFFSAHVLAYNKDGMLNNDDFSDFQWLTHEELQENLGKAYYQAVRKFLISDL